MSISMSTKRCTSAVWEFFELMEVADDAGKKHKKAICKFCEGVTLAYAGGTSNLFNHLEAKHPVAHTKAVPRECPTQKQTTLGTFATACPPAQANRITTLIAVCGKRLASYIHSRWERLPATTRLRRTWVQNTIPPVYSLLHVAGFTVPWRNSCWKLQPMLIRWFSSIRTSHQCLQCNLNLPSLSWDVLLSCLYTLIVFDAVHLTCLKVSDATVCTSELET